MSATEPAVSSDVSHEAAKNAPPYTLGQLARYALRLGAVGFGGPVALVGYMHRDLVERRKWITEADYKEGLTLAQLMPGPLAAQLAIYVGFVHYGVLGATLVGLGFVLPSFVIVVALGWAYVTFGGLPWMQAVFYGVGASVIGIITISAHKLTRKTLGRDWMLWPIYMVSAAVTIITENEELLFFLGAGVLVWLVRTPPRLFRRNGASAPAVLGPALLALPGAVAAQPHVLVQIALFFSKAGAFVFGSGLAIIPFLYSGVVKQYAWLTEHEFLDAVAVAMITPGPVVITVGFIGYLVTGRPGGPAAGLLGASVASFATFLPCYLLTIIPAPYFKKHGKRPGIVAFVDGVTAAAVGAIAGACVVLARRTLFDKGWDLDVAKLAILLVTLALLLRFKKLQEPVVVLGAALVGLALYPLLHR